MLDDSGQWPLFEPYASPGEAHTELVALGLSDGLPLAVQTHEAVASMLEGVASVSNIVGQLPQLFGDLRARLPYRS